MSMQTQFKHVFLKFIGMVAVLVLVSIPFVILNLYHPQAIHTLSTIMTQNRLIFTLSRLSGLVLFFFLWPTLIHCFGRKQQWSAEKRAFWLQQRFRVLLWLLLCDLIFCENLPLLAWQLWEKY
jgi:hypothetical protein